MAQCNRGPLVRDWWWIFDPRESLRASAALMFGGGAVLFTLLIAWISTTIQRRELEAQLGASFEAYAAQASTVIDTRIHQRFRDLQLLASLPAVRDTRAPPAERRRVLEALQVTAPDFAWVGIADASGRIVAATRGRFEGESARERPWFAGAMDQPHAATVHEMPSLAGSPPGSDSDRRVYDLAVPLSGLNGEFAGVLGSHLRWGWSRELPLALLPERVRQAGVGITVYDANGGVLLDSGASGWSEPPDAPVLPPRKPRGTMIESTREGSAYLTGYIRSRGHGEYRGLGWVTVVRQPVAKAFAPAQELRFAIARWGFGFSALFFVTGWVFAGRIARRLDAVGAAARRIHSRDVLAVIPPPRGEQEIDRMCGAVSDLVEELRPRESADHASEGSAGHNAPPPPSNYIRPTGADPRRVIW